MPARLAGGEINARNVGDAWLHTMRMGLDAPDHRLFHLVIRIADPIADEPRIRQAADALLADLELPPIDTVANTIFPKQLAATSRSYEQLVRRYRAAYPTLHRFKGNNRGTYFGRLVAYPGADGRQIDQLGDLVRKLKAESSSARPMAARYELAITTPSDPLIEPPTGIDDTEISTAGLPIYYPDKDYSYTRGFPCLTYCSFQLDRTTVHAIAHYRSQYLIQRAYGNYLGLGRLLGYVAAQTGLVVGELMVVAAYAKVERSIRRAQAAIDAAHRSLV